MAHRLEFRRSETGMIGRLLSLMLFAVAAEASAQPQQAGMQPRVLEVPQRSSWQHAETGLILPPQIGGLVRSEIKDLGEGEMDIVATYADREQGLIGLVYIFRTTTPDVAMWFDRAVATVVTPQGAAYPAVAAFARPGASAASGLRATMADNVAGMSGTGIALAPLGSWLVKIRIGSSRLEPAALDAPLGAFVAGIRWPAEAAPARAAVPVEPCPRPLRLRTARLVRTDMTNTLVDLMAGVAADEEDAGPPPLYCREPGATAAYGVYRPDGATDRYVIALSDNGIAVAVGRAIDIAALLGQGSGGRRYSVTLLDRDGTGAYPSFNRLPLPAQALALVGSGPPGLSATIGEPKER